MKKPEKFDEFEVEKDISKEENELEPNNKIIYEETKHLFIVKEQKTAKIPWKRTKWRRIISLIKKWKIKWLISYSPDRQSRNMLEWWELIDLVDQWLVDLKYVNFYFENNASWKMMLWIWFVFSKQYSDKLSEDIQRWKKSKHESWKALWIYKHWYKINKEWYFEPHPVFFPLIKKAFEMKIYDNKSDHTIVTRLKANWYYKLSGKGVKSDVSEKNFYRVRIDPVYYWMFTVNEKVIDLREVNPHYHPIISEAEHNILLNNYLKSKNKKIWTKENKKYDEITPFWNNVVTEDDFKLSFYLPNPSRFDKKLNRLQSEWKKVTLKDVVTPEQIRYKCWNKNSNHYKLEIQFSKLEKAIINMLKKLNITDEMYQEYVKFATNWMDKLYKKSTEERNRITLAINKLKWEKNNLIKKNMRIERDEDEQKIYENTKKELDKNIELLKDEIWDLDTWERNKILEFEIFLDILQKADQYYKKADYVQKRKISKILFSNILVGPKKIIIKPVSWLEVLFTLNGGAGGYRTRV